jgi:hypothetical protein
MFAAYGLMKKFEQFKPECHPSCYLGKPAGVFNGVILQKDDGDTLPSNDKSGAQLQKEAVARTLLTLLKPIKTAKLSQIELVKVLRNMKTHKSLTLCLRCKSRSYPSSGSCHELAIKTNWLS